MLVKIKDFNLRTETGSIITVMKLNERKKTIKYLLSLFALAAIAAAICGVVFLTAPDKVLPNVSAQQDPFLAQRLNRIEQQFNTIESRLNRLEQSSRLPAPVTPRIDENNDAEVRLLRSQIEILQLRLAQLECGVLKLDERTLSSAARQARKKSSAAAASEECRQNTYAPLQIAARP